MPWDWRAAAKTDDATIRMKPQPEPSTQEVLAGLAERVNYHNEENGFCVPRIKARGHRELATVIGHAAAISAGEWFTASGEWINDRTHGQKCKRGGPCVLKNLGAGFARRHREMPWLRHDSWHRAGTITALDRDEFRSKRTRHARGISGTRLV
ncbi:MAG: YrrC family ATP-dependent DNA helicase [Methylocella sp.]